MILLVRYINFIIKTFPLAEHILRMSPPLIMPEEVADKALDVVKESIAETEKELGY